MRLKFLTLFDIFMLLCITTISYTALYIQLAYHELPCPLCLLQRIGILGISMGYILNLCFGHQSRHYAVSAIIAILTSIIAMIQILMHIVPDSGGYGSLFLGLHLYTWVFIIGITISFVNLFVILLINQNTTAHAKLHQISVVAIIWIIFCLGINICLAFAECGLKVCPSDPSSYWISQFIKK